MPNEIGLLTKQEAKAIRDLKALPDYNRIMVIAEIIRQMQVDGTHSSFACNMVVNDAVESYFKNTMQYSTDFVKQGYPNGTGLLRSISWT